MNRALITTVILSLALLTTCVGCSKKTKTNDVTPSVVDSSNTKNPTTISKYPKIDTFYGVWVCLDTAGTSDVYITYVSDSISQISGNKFGRLGYNFTGNIKTTDSMLVNEGETSYTFYLKNDCITGNYLQNVGGWAGLYFGGPYTAYNR